MNEHLETVFALTLMCNSLLLLWVACSVLKLKKYTNGELARLAALYQNLAVNNERT